MNAPLLAGPVPPSVADDVGWTTVREGEISVYTQGETSEAGLLLEKFSQLQHALAQTSIFQINEATPLKVIDFHTAEQFNQYRLNSGSCAFFQQTQRAEYVVLQDRSLEYQGVSTHEFTHFLMAHSGYTLPLWLNEGIADFYSTFEISGERVTFGRSVSGRLPVLESRGWIPIENLFQMASSSAYHSDSQRTLMFYSESWALTHMLMVSPGYADRFPDFLGALKEGHTSAESARLAYGKTPNQIQQDLREYLDQQHLPVIEARLRSATHNAPSVAAAVSNTEMAMTLGDLRAGNSRTESGTIENRVGNR